VCILAIGKLVASAERAAQDLADEGVDVTVWDVRCCVPLDEAMIVDAARHTLVVTCEDGIRDGGVGMTIADRVHHACGTDPLPHVEVLGVPTRFIPTAKPDRILAGLKLDGAGLAATIRDLLSLR
jgi:1-deoxy-D-xylulose-5-phosphate synthase